MDMIEQRVKDLVLKRADGRCQCDIKSHNHPELKHGKRFGKKFFFIISEDKCLFLVISWLSVGIVIP